MSLLAVVGPTPSCLRSKLQSRKAADPSPKFTSCSSRAMSSRFRFGMSDNMSANSSASLPKTRIEAWAGRCIDKQVTAIMSSAVILLSETLHANINEQTHGR